MAVSQIEEKILGRLATLTAPSNPLLSASLYQVLGLSILLSRKLYRARKLRRLDQTRDTKSLQLYHQIIWLAREGLSITEVYILPYSQDGEQGPECRVMAAKLRASLYHVFCLFHNHPPVSHINGRSVGSGSPSSSKTSPKAANGTQSPSQKSPGNQGNDGKRRARQAALRDAIPSMTSEASYVTNPYASPTPPPFAAQSRPNEARRTPSRPPGLAPINVSSSQAAASFLLPPLNFVPMAIEHFDTAQHLANSLLSPTHALRLSVSLEHAAFLWDCAKEQERARKLARRTIKEVYSSPDGLDDEEFASASVLVQALGGIVRRGSNESTPSRANTSPNQRSSTRQYPYPVSTQPLIDRTIAVSPTEQRNNTTSPSQLWQTSPRNASAAQQIPRSIMRTPERLSTVPEVESVDEAGTTRPPSTAGGRTTGPSPPVSRLSTRSHSQSQGSRTRSRHRRASSVTSQASDKAAKRRIVEQAEFEALSRQASSSAGATTRASPPQYHTNSSQSRTSPPQSGPDERKSPGVVAEDQNQSQNGDKKQEKRSPSISSANGGGGGDRHEGSQHSRQATPTEGTPKSSSSSSNSDPTESSSPLTALKLPSPPIQRRPVPRRPTPVPDLNRSPRTGSAGKNGAVGKNGGRGVAAVRSRLAASGDGIVQVEGHAAAAAPAATAAADVTAKNAATVAKATGAATRTAKIKAATTGKAATTAPLPTGKRTRAATLLVTQPKPQSQSKTQPRAQLKPKPPQGQQRQRPLAPKPSPQHQREQPSRSPHHHHPPAKPPHPTAPALSALGQTASSDRREAILRTLQILSAVTRGLHIPSAPSPSASACATSRPTSRPRKGERQRGKRGSGGG